MGYTIPTEIRHKLFMEIKEHLPYNGLIDSTWANSLYVTVPGMKSPVQIWLDQKYENYTRTSTVKLVLKGRVTKRYLKVIFKWKQTGILDRKAVGYEKIDHDKILKKIQEIKLKEA